MSATFADGPPDPTARTLVLAIANQKGGVGKTTTAVNLATVLAAGHKTLLIDLDPQGNASTGLGALSRSRGAGSYALLGGAPLHSVAIAHALVPNLSHIVAEPGLVGAEVELASMDHRETCLRQALRQPDVAAEAFRYVILDCPPSLGLLTLNALVAASRVLVPLQCEFYALEGLTQIVGTIEQVRSRHNEQLRLDGILLTMVDRRNKMSEAVVQEARRHFGTAVYDTTIPRNVRVSEAPSHGLPITLYDHKSPGAQAYVRLGAEMLRRQRALVS